MLSHPLRLTGGNEALERRMRSLTHVPACPVNEITLDIQDGDDDTDDAQADKKISLHCHVPLRWFAPDRWRTDGLSLAGAGVATNVVSSLREAFLDRLGVGALAALDGFLIPLLDHFFFQ